MAMVGREQVGCASGSGGGTVDDKLGEDDERDGRRETGRKETGRREKGRKET